MKQLADAIRETGREPTAAETQAIRTVGLLEGSLGIIAYTLRRDAATLDLKQRGHLITLQLKATTKQADIIAHLLGGSVDPFAVVDSDIDPDPENAASEVVGDQEGNPC